MNREDFLILDNKKNMIYFDNAATTLKPKQVVNSITDYFNYYTANIHRGMYDTAVITDYLYDSTRMIIKKFINCSSPKEVIFTSGTTHSINLVVFSFMKYYLRYGDEVLLSKAEHASNILPWLVLQKEIKFVIKYIPLNDDFSLDYSALEKMITNKTKVISIAHVTNVIGDVRDIDKIGLLCKRKNVLFHVDGAQSVPHLPVDFEKANIDFLSFSGHKMCGPTGIGCLVVKQDILKKMQPLLYGGGMNLSFSSDGNYLLKDIPVKFEAGTPPIAEVLGFRMSIEYLLHIGLDKIHNYERDLKIYLLNQLEKIPFITIYNKDLNSGILSFTVDNIDSVDVSRYLNSFGICVRAGSHCSKLLKENLFVPSTVRVSLYFYNTKEEIDKLVKALYLCKKAFYIVS